MARQLAKLGGFLTERDLAAQGAYWGEPLRGTYRGVTICETPAPTQGFTVLEMLNLLEPLQLGPYLGPDHVHFLVQAKQIAYHDRDRWLADPRFADTDGAPHLQAACGERRNLLDAKRACPGTRCRPTAVITVYVAAVDAEGNAASLIFSLYGIFGACVTRRDRRDASEPWRLFLAGPQAPQPAGAGQGAAAYADRVSLSGTSVYGRCSAAWAPTASRRSTCRPISR